MKDTILFWQHAAFVQGIRVAVEQSGFPNYDDLTSLDSIPQSMERHPIKVWIFDMHGTQPEYALMEQMKARYPDCHVICIVPNPTVDDYAMQMGADLCIRIDNPTLTSTLFRALLALARK